MPDCPVVGDEADGDVALKCIVGLCG